MMNGRARARWLVWVAAAWVAGPSLLPEMAWAAPVTTSAASIEDPRDRDSALVVEVDPATLDADPLRARVLDEGTKTLARRPEALGPEDEIRVRVEGQTFDYRIIVELRHRGRALAEQPEPSTCQCSSSELLSAVAAAIDDGAHRLQEAAAAETQNSTSTAADRGPTEQAAPAQPTVRVRPERSDRLWVAGVVLTSIGAATSVAGTTMALVGPQPVESHGFIQRDWRPPGYALIGVGAAMLVGGVTMLVVDELRCRRRGRCRSQGGIDRRQSDGTRREHPNSPEI
jgi:hypothetical protein